MSRHQRGYIFEASGAFHVRYYSTVNGVRKQLSHRLCAKDRTTGHGSPSAKAVRTLCEDFMRSVNTELPTPSKSTIVEFWDKTYLPFITSNLKYSTVFGYKQNWNNHLKAHFGTTRLRDYKTPMGSMFITGLAKTLRPRTLQHIKFLASGIFMHAVNTGEVDSNPWRDCRVLGKTLEDGKTEAYTLEEIENVISCLVDHVECQLIMALATFAGLRKGEIQGLQWGDLDDKYCHVRRAWCRGVLGTPKTKKSVRSVPLIAPVRLLVGLWRAKGTGTGWVFPNGSGGAADLDVFAYRVIKPTLERAGVPWKGFHAGRRGLGTALRSLTGNSNAGRDILGHNDNQVTEQHYEAAMPEEALKGMKLLEAQVTKQ